MRSSPRALRLTGLILLIAPAALAGQARTFQGGSMDRILGLPGHAVAFTYRRTEASRHGLGIDLGIGIFPAALAGRVLRLQVDAGIAHTQMAGPAALVLKAGVGSRLDVIAAAEFLPGLQAGIAVILPLERRCGLRVDLTRRLLFPDGGVVSQWSLGVGLTILPSRRPARRT